MLVQNNKPAEAEAVYRQALRAAPANPEASARLGMLLVDTGKDAVRQKEAQDLLVQAQAAWPDDAYTLYALGKLYLNRGDGKQAAACLQAAIAHATQVDTAELWYALSRAYRLQKDEVRADQAMRVADRLREEYQGLRLAEEQATQRPHEPGLRLKLARFYAQRGENAKAIDQYQSCLRLDAGNAAARKELAALQNRLSAAGKMPSMIAFHRMVAATGSQPGQ
jgi:tetratricopeptide (TPR) repeat protein